MNIIKFDRTQNKTQNLIPIKYFESKIRKKMYLQIIIIIIKVHHFSLTSTTCIRIPRQTHTHPPHSHTHTSTLYTWHAVFTQVIVGGVNLLEQTEEQEHMLEKSQRELEKRRKKEAKLREQLQRKEAERLDIEEKYASLHEEAVGKTKRLKQVWKQLQQAKDEVQWRVSVCIEEICLESLCMCTCVMHVLYDWPMYSILL